MLSFAELLDDMTLNTGQNTPVYIFDVTTLGYKLFEDNTTALNSIEKMEKIEKIYFSRCISRGVAGK